MELQTEPERATGALPFKVRALFFLCPQRQLVSIMSEAQHFLVSFDAEVSEAMAAAFDRAWGSVARGLSREQACHARIHLARAILDLVHEGERDPSRLSERALASLASAKRKGFALATGL
jgi:hypothetical protein